MSRPSRRPANQQGAFQLPAFVRRSPPLKDRIEASLPACILNSLVRSILKSELNPRQRALYSSLMPDLIEATDAPFDGEPRPIKERLVEIADRAARYAIERNGVSRDPLPLLLATFYWLSPIVGSGYLDLYEDGAFDRVYRLLSQEINAGARIERNREDFLASDADADRIAVIIRKRLESIGLFVGASEVASDEARAA